MRAAAVSKSYARVLFDLASSANKVDVVNKDIQALGLLCKKMNSLFLSIDQQAPIKKKKEFLSVLLSHGKLNYLTKKFLELLRIENKLSCLYYVSESFTDLYQENENILQVKVRSVEKLDKIAENKLTKFFSDLLKKQVSIDNVTDKHIMGGMVIEIGSYVIDNSFVNKLRRIKLDTDKI